MATPADTVIRNGTDATQERVFPGEYSHLGTGVLGVSPSPMGPGGERRLGPGRGGAEADRPRGRVVMPAAHRRACAFAAPGSPTRRLGGTGSPAAPWAASPLSSDMPNTDPARHAG